MANYVCMYNRFKKGRENVNEDEGRPTKSKTVKITVKIIIESLSEILLIMLAYRLAHDKQYLRKF